MSEQTEVCRACDKRPAVCVPVIVVPVSAKMNGKRFPLPTPLYLLFKGGLCNNCAYSFSLDKWTDYEGSWYDFAGDGLREYRKIAKDPFPPGDPDRPEDWSWEVFVLNPDYEPAPKEQCTLKFWNIKALQAQKAEVNLETRKLKLSK